MTSFELLTSPIRIGGLEIRNRMFMPAMHLALSADGLCRPEIVQYYGQVSRGGAGMIVVGGIAVNKEGSDPMMLLLYTQEHADALKPLTQAIRSGGAVPAIQLFHAGRYAFGMLNGVPAVSSSPVESPFTHEVPREMSKEDIERTIQSFVDSARLAVDAGFQAIQLIMSAGYLFNQFLSPAVNHRTDEYGGSFENRVRFPRQVIRAVKDAVDCPVGVRFSGSDFVDNGNGPEEQVRIAAALAEEGLAWFDVTGGWHESRVPQITMEVPTAGYAFLARRVRDVVGVPVVASNRIRDPRDAENLLRWGYADALNLGRQLIADPEYPNKIVAGQHSTVRPCLSCNEGCLDKVFSGEPVDCVVNPNVHVKTVKQAGRFAVIGAGPAGMEAAVLLADMGNQVGLFESGPEIGGQLRLASIPPGRGEYRRMIRFYQAALDQRDNIQLHLNTLIDTPEQVADFDGVLWTAGATPVRPEIPGQGPMYSAWDVLDGKVAPGRKVLVIGGGPTGLETAIYLAAEGTMTAEQLRFHLLFGSVEPSILREELLRGFRKVTVVEVLSRIGNGLGRSSRWVIIGEAKALGIDMLTEAKVTWWDGSTARFSQGDKVLEQSFDSLVYAVGVRPVQPDFLQGAGIPVVVAGDADSPGNLGAAIRSARDGVEKLLASLPGC